MKALDRASVRAQSAGAMQSTEHRASRREGLALVVIAALMICVLHAPLEALLASTWGWITAAVTTALEDVL